MLAMELSLWWIDKSIDPASVTFVLTSEPPLKVAVAVAVLIPRLSAVVRPAPNGSVMFKSNVPSSYPDPAFVIVNPVKDPEVILAVTVAPSFEFHQK